MKPQTKTHHATARISFLAGRFIVAIALALSGAGVAQAQSLDHADFSTLFGGQDLNLGTSVSIFNNAVNITARSFIDPTQPTNQFASGQQGTVYYEFDNDPFKGGLGVQTIKPDGSHGISGGGGHQDEEIILTLNSNPQFGALNLQLNGWKPNDDTPFLWVNTNLGTFSFNSAAMFAAATSNTNDSYTIDFDNLNAPQGALVSSLAIRETEGHIFVKGFTEPTVTTTAVPEPGSAALLLSSIVGAMFCTRRRRSVI